LKVVVICEVWTIVHKLFKAKSDVFQFDEAWLGNWEHKHVTWCHTWVSPKIYIYICVSCEYQDFEPCDKFPRG